MQASRPAGHRHSKQENCREQPPPLVILSYQADKQQPTPYRNHERDRSPPGRPVRQPDRCQVLGGEELKSAPGGGRWIIQSAAQQFFRPTAKCPVWIREGGSGVGGWAVGNDIPDPGLGWDGPQSRELAWPRVEGLSGGRPPSRNGWMAGTRLNRAPNVLEMP